MKPQEAIGKETLELLIQWHLHRYQAMAERGGPGIRVGECRDLIRVWQTTEKCHKNGIALPDECQNELFDALTCGDFDKWLTEEELARLQELY